MESQITVCKLGIRALTNSAENVTDTYNYIAFGEIYSQSGTTANDGSCIDRMQSHDSGKMNSMERDFHEFAKFQADPSTWGDKAWNDNTIDPLLIWQWAEDQNRLDLMSCIAEGVATHVLKTYYGRERDEKVQEWTSKIEHLAEDAKSNNQTEIYVGFLEALLRLNYLEYRDIEKVAEILSLYKQLGKREKIVFYLWKKSTTLNGFLARGELTSSENEIWELLVEAYKISKEINFQKGLALALDGLGYYLGRKNKNKLALKFLYQAHAFASKAHTKYGISAIEELRKIRDKSNIPASEYEIDDVDTDMLIKEFIREIDT